MSESVVLAEVEGPVAVLTLNLPARRNPLSRRVLTELRGHLDRLATAPDRVVILRAAGPVFSAGHDLRELADATEAEAAALFVLCTEVMLAIRRLPKPVLAEVQGVATAAGCQLAAACDLVVAAEEATFAAPGVKIGLFCTTPGVALARAVPPRKALEMLLTGEPVSAREAERLGLVNRVVPRDRLSEEALALARQIAATPPTVVALGKRAFYEQVSLAAEAAYAAAGPVMAANAALPEAREGIRAFLDKRPPRWPSDA